MNELELRILNLIYQYGGYSRIYHLSSVITDITYNQLYKVLSGLVTKGYLDVIKFQSTSLRESNTYKVTYKTCAYFSDNNSFLRKEHSVATSFRYLIMNQFALTYYDILGDSMKSKLSDKVELLKREFNDSDIPHKIIRGKMTHIFEEYIIDNRRLIGDLIDNDEINISNQTYDFIIVSFDKPDYPPDRFIKKTINTFSNMMVNKSIKIGFIFVFDTSGRVEVYKKSKFHFQNRNKHNEIDYLTDYIYNLMLVNGSINELFGEDYLAFKELLITNSWDLESRVDEFSLSKFESDISTLENEFRLNYAKECLIHVVNSSCNFHLISNKNTVYMI